MASYSEKPLVEKLSYKPGDKLQLFQAPDWFKEEVGKSGVIITDHSPTWLHAFFHHAVEIDKFLQTYKENQPEKGLWVSWPKKSSGIKTDVTEQTFRDLILPLGWVDTKVAAIDDSWSGLLFYRRKN